MGMPNGDHTKNVTSEIEIIRIVANQRRFFESGATRDYQVRVQRLKQLKSAIAAHEEEFKRALKQDLGKPEYEAYVSEIGYCLYDLTETLRKLKKWMKPKRVKTSLLTQPGVSHIHYFPLGVNLIIAPYNYPVTLTFSPLTAAIAAGNTAAVKTSELTPACSEVTRHLIEETFDPEVVVYISGEVPETTILLQQKFDHIFFTGSPRVGSIVMSAAAKHLAKVTLELGGKSPCIVHKDANQTVAVNRIVSSKFLNAGQTCIAPDYVMVHRDIKEEFLAKLKHRVIESYGEDASKSQDFGRIVSHNHFERIRNLIDLEKVIVGGQTEARSRFIAPTVMRDVTQDDKVMSEEIFGPVLPVLDYTGLNEVKEMVANLPPHPLAFYLFSESQEIQDELVSEIQFGGGCINNCMLHLINSHLPFGGVGQSGMGAYHGFYGFEQFSHRTSVLKSASWPDIPVLYAPYRDKIKFMRKLLK